MKIPYNWVRELVDVKLSAEDAADRLVNAGLEVASVTPIGGELKGVVVGEIEAVERELGESHGHTIVLVRVSTDEGITGWGEGFGHRIFPATKAVIDTMLAPLCIGRDPLAIASLNSELQRGLTGSGTP